MKKSRMEVKRLWAQVALLEVSEVECMAVEDLVESVVDNEDMDRVWMVDVVVEVLSCFGQGRCNDELVDRYIVFVGRGNVDV
jgi:hypothetical protein